MKGIEFRVWDKIEKKWANDEHVLCTNGELLGLNTKWENFFVEDMEKHDVSFFTGLKDKNGVNVFEGDVVKIKLVYEDRTFISEVIFRNCCFFVGGGKYAASEPLGHYSVIEVIGNVWENPELLKNES